MLPVFGMIYIAIIVLASFMPTITINQKKVNSPKRSKHKID